MSRQSSPTGSKVASPAVASPTNGTIDEEIMYWKFDPTPFPGICDMQKRIKYVFLIEMIREEHTLKIRIRSPIIILDLTDVLIVLLSNVIHIDFQCGLK